MDPDLFLWVLARVAGLSSFAALAIATLTGIGLRTGVLDWVGGSRVLRSLHEYTVVLWLPLGGLHVVALLLDRTARVGLLDVLVPFRMPYGTVAVGLGTLSLELFALVTVTGWLRHRMPARTWQWLHRLSYASFGLLFVHGLLAGSDFSDPAVSALTWAVGALVGVLALARLLWGRLPA